MNTPNRPPHISGKNILCLAIDRLNADFLGAYGNAWVETPAFDALAAESVLFDSFFATSLDLETLYRAFWRGESPARVVAATDDETTNEESSEAETTVDRSNDALNGAKPGDFNAADAAPPSIFRLLKEKGYRTFVVSDDETVALHPAVEDEFCDGRFFLGSPDAALPAETLEETQFFRNFEELARFLAKLEDDAKCADGGDSAPWFVWAHFSGWNERWDFPLELRERFQEDEDDPAPYSATLVPYWPLEEGAKSAKRGARVAENAVVEAALARAAAILDAENAAADSELPAEVEIEFNVEFDDAEAPDAELADDDLDENDAEFADDLEENDEFESESDDETESFENDDDWDESDDAILDESAVERQLAATELARLAQLDAPERRQAVVEGYCGGVAAFDETLEGFVQLLKESGVLAKTLLLTTATRGFPTGAPSALGVEPTPESAAADVFAPTPFFSVDSSDGAGSLSLPISASSPDGANDALYATGANGETSRFYAESLQLPLAIRLPNGVGATVRLPALCEPRDVFATLRDWPEFAAELATPEFWSFEAIEISPFAGKWSAETEIAEELDADDVLAVEKERTAGFDAAAPDVPGQNLLRLLANEDGVLRDRVSVVARDAESEERALVVADWILKETPLASGVDVDDFSGTGAFVADAATLTAAPNAVDSPDVATRLSRFELFVRPDDRYNVNDVANRCVEIVEKLAPALRPSQD